MQADGRVREAYLGHLNKTRGELSLVKSEPVGKMSSIVT